MPDMHPGYCHSRPQAQYGRGIVAWKFAMRVAAGAASAWLAGLAAASAGAFNPDPGRGVAILTSSFADAPAWRDGAGRLFKAPGYGKFEASLHLEIGLTEWLAAIARPRFVATRTDAAPALSDHGPGASEFGAQAQILRSGGFVLAAQALARVPGGARSPLHDRRGGAEARLMAGSGFELAGRPAFAEAHVALRRRDGWRRNETLIDVTIGWRPRAPLLVMLQSFTTIETSGPRPALWTKAQATMVWDLDARWSISLAGFATLHARRAPRERGVALGLWRRF